MTSVKNVLSCPMKENDASASTVGDYLSCLLKTLWEEGEGFSGKRPFGNSGWEYEIYTALAAKGLCGGKLDDFGDIEKLDFGEANRLIFKAIDAVFSGYKENE